MFRKFLLSAACSVFLASAAFAQGGIRGVVSDAGTGEELPGVNVVLVEIQRGVATDAFGRYELTGVPAGSYTLTATFVGYKRYQTQITIGNSVETLDISLEQDVLGLEDVVVTAFGIEREARALGYGVSSVAAENIENRQETDIARALTGQLPGVDITATGGLTGSGTDIVIRGFTTLTGSNDPLIIVDGVRFEGSANTSSSFAFGGGLQTTPNRLLDLDPKNIKDITVLKGLSATVLYGEQGRNGVIIVTTKSGDFGGENPGSGFSITLDQSVYATEISSRPTYQNTYGGGFDQFFGWFFSNWGPKFSETDPAIFGSFRLPNGEWATYLDNPGVSFMGFDTDGTVLIRHPLMSHSGTRGAFPELATATYRYEAKPNPIDAFFRTGLASTTNLNISGGTEDIRVNVTYSRSSEEGFTPNNTLDRDAFSIGASYKVTDRLTAQTTFNMALTDMTSPPTSAGGGSGPAAGGGSTSVFADIMYTPRSIDLSMPFSNPVTGGSSYYRGGNDIPHPVWTSENVRTMNNTQRFFGKTEFRYRALDGVNLVYRLGYDTYNEYQEYRQNPGGVRPAALNNGFFQTIDLKGENWDHNLNAIFDFQLTEAVSLDGTLGAQYISERRERQGLESKEMIIFGFFEHTNFTNQAATNFFSGADFQNLIERETAGVFAEATIGYDDVIYLNVAGRNDWFSTLEQDNRSIFYPSTNISWIASDMLNLSGDVLSYLKFFAGVGTSAGSPGVYSTRNVLSSNARAFVDVNGSVITTNATSSFLGNPELKPELHTEYEFGTDVRLFNGRLGLEASVYSKTVTDLITESPLDPGTGFTSTLVNIGNIQNQGIEAVLRATPLTGPLQWDVSANFVKTTSEVKELSEQLDRIQVGGGFANRGNFAIVGEPFLIMLGTKIVRDDSGTPVVDSQGNYVEADDIDIIGDPNPDWKMGISNSFRYKGASLSFQIDYQQGGDMFSTWISTLMARGLTKDTDVVDRNNTFILPGVKADGSPNNIQISPSDVFFGNFGFGPDELRVYDMTHIRLSNISLSYDVPSSILANTPVKQVTISLTGDNLWMKAFNVPEYSGFDPNVNSIGGTSRGFEYLTGPAARRFGGSIRVRL